MAEEMSLAESLARFALAVAAGMAIGLEREWREKAAGFRTITLVAAGAALFTLSGGVGFGPEDRARIAQGVVTGIGFLGAGTILRERGQIMGLTTAAAVWVAAALGMTAALGSWQMTLAGIVVALIVLLVFPKVDFSRTAYEARLYGVVSPYSAERLAALRRRLDDAGLAVESESVSRRGGDMVVEWRAHGTPGRHDEATRSFMEDPEVSEIEVR